MFCFPKDFLIKGKREVIKWENTFTIHISNEGLIFRICREFIQIISKSWENPVVKIFEETLHRRQYQRVLKHKNMLNTINHQKRPIKINMRVPYIFMSGSN